MSSEAGNGEGALLVAELLPKEQRRDLALIRRAVRERWPVTQERMNKVAARVFKIVEECEDDDTVLEASRVVLVMAAQNQKEEPAPAQQVEHHHTHELGPITETNIEQHRAVRLARLAVAVPNT